MRLGDFRLLLEFFCFFLQETFDLGYIEVVLSGKETGLFLIDAF